MSRVNHQVVANRLTRNRLASYLHATGYSLGSAIDLYDWNTLAGGALREDLGRLEVLFRNAIDDALVRYGRAQGWQASWYRRTQLFPGKPAYRSRADVAEARRRATRGGRHPELHGKVIAELGFGFWRYLCEPPYHTSLWVPALTSAVAQHPSAPNTQRVREELALLHVMASRAKEELLFTICARTNGYRQNPSRWVRLVEPHAVKVN